VPEDGAGKAALSQEHDQSIGSYTVAHLSGLLKRIEGNLVAGSRAINAEPPERRYERVSAGTELGGPAGRCWLPTFEDDLIGAGIGIEPNSDETTQSMTGFSRANASSARR